MGRSFKYHRPRGLVAAGPEEPNALVGIGEGGRFEPNQRATVTELYNGLVATSQNHWPSLDFDIGAINAGFARFLPAGFYYKTFIHPRFAWKHLFEPVIRRSAGLGRAPVDRDADHYEHFHHHTDMLIVGGGIAGLQAALAAAASGASVLLSNRPATGAAGRPVDGAVIDGVAGRGLGQATPCEALETMPNVRLRAERTPGPGSTTTAMRWPMSGSATPAPATAGPRHRLWRIRARHVVTATGAIERPLAFAGNDLPGVMLASAVRDYAVNWAVSPGDRTVIVTNNDDAYRTAMALHGAGLVVPAILDARPAVAGALVEARARPGHPGRGRQGHGQGPRRQAGHRRRGLRPGRRGRGARGDRLRRGGDVGRLVAGRASVVALRRQADLGRGRRPVPPRSRAPADRRRWRRGGDRGGRRQRRRSRPMRSSPRPMPPAGPRRRPWA